MTGGILLFGATGQVGLEILRHAPLAPAGIIPVPREQVELTDTAAIAAAIAQAKPALVINASAYTEVDKAESEPDLAAAINRDAPAAMARSCAGLDIPFLHISTDYVFDGTKDGAYAETDPVAPLGAYGTSKLEGEQAVAQAWAKHVILRTSWVFSAHRKNFVKTMLRLAEIKDELGIVDDQRGGPTDAAAIARALLAIASKALAGHDAWGIYHFSGAPNVTWRQFAEEIFNRAGGKVPHVKAITTADYPTPARRPANSRLDCARLEQAWGVARPDWRQGLDAVLAELRGTK